MDPISPMWQFGLGIGGVVVCTVLFIWNNLQINAMQKSLTDLGKELSEQRKLMGDMLEAQQKFMSKISEQQTAIATNQLNLTNSVNEVVRELIGIIRQVENG